MSAIPKPKRERDEEYLAWVRTRLCCVYSPYHNGLVEAHHVRHGSDSGVGTKPADVETVPLCRYHHAAYHQIGHDSFERTYGVSLRVEMMKLKAEYRPLPKKTDYKKPMKVKLWVDNCSACGRHHDVPRAKLKPTVEGGLRFKCIDSNQDIEVWLSEQGEKSE